MRLLLAALGCALLLSGSVSAHGAIEPHEAETLAISDFEGGEDAFPWGGWEIWDVYVGEAYNESLDADGVYVKANLAGSGETRAPGQSEWTLTVSFLAGNETVERSLVHDGETITGDFDSIEHMVADRNVLIVKAFVALPGVAGATLTELLLTSGVDGEPRDEAPGGIYAPLLGVAVPGPVASEGRIVDEVALRGPAGYVDAEPVALGDGRFRLQVKNLLAEQGQHVHVAPRATDGWAADVADPGTLNLEGAGSGDLLLNLTTTAPAGTLLAPMRIDLVTDIGGRTSLWAVLVDGRIALVKDAEALAPGAIPAEVLEAPGFAALAAVGALLGARLRRR